MMIFKLILILLYVTNLFFVRFFLIEYHFLLKSPCSFPRISLRMNKQTNIKAPIRL